MSLPLQGLLLPQHFLQDVSLSNRNSDVYAWGCGEHGRLGNTEDEKQGLCSFTCVVGLGDEDDRSLPEKMLEIPGIVIAHRATPVTLDRTQSRGERCSWS